VFCPGSTLLTLGVARHGGRHVEALAGSTKLPGEFFCAHAMYSVCEACCHSYGRNLISQEASATMAAARVGRLRAARSTVPNFLANFLRHSDQMTTMAASRTTSFTMQLGGLWRVSPEVLCRKCNYDGYHND